MAEVNTVQFNFSYKNGNKTETRTINVERGIQFNFGGKVFVVPANAKTDKPISVMVDKKFVDNLSEIADANTTDGSNVLSDKDLQHYEAIQKSMNSYITTNGELVYFHKEGEDDVRVMSNGSKSRKKAEHDAEAASKKALTNMLNANYKKEHPTLSKIYDFFGWDYPIDM